MAGLRGALGLAVLLPLLAAAGLPGLGDGRRVVVDEARAPWSSLVRVQVAGVSRCTGVVIAPRRVLTAAHCLFNPRVGHFVPPGSVHVLTRYAAGGYGRHLRVAVYATLAGWTPQNRLFGLDAAVLTLEAEAGVPALALADAPPGPALLAGYNQDRAEVLEADPDCAVLGVTADAAGDALLRHDCAATRGTSGAALLVRDGAGWAVGGLQSGAVAGRGGVAVPAATLRRLGG